MKLKWQTDLGIITEENNMGMILNDHITKLKKGYPTVSDKYDVSGGVLGGDEAVEVGTIMALTDEDGVFVPVSAETPAEKVAGIALAPNVKLTDIWSGSKLTLIQPGEAVNLCFNGLFAAEVGADVVAAIKPGAPVGLKDGALVVFVEGGTATRIADWFFTGCVEGELAEIDIRR